jgi:hypothetical protein
VRIGAGGSIPQRKTAQDAALPKPRRSNTFPKKSRFAQQGANRLEVKRL